MSDTTGEDLALPSRMELLTLRDERWARACAAWPEVMLEPRRFWGFVAERTVAGDPAALLAELSALHTDELYLTCACAFGDSRAHALLEARYFPRVIAQLARRGLEPATTDELAQRLRVKLLVGPAPKIAAYAGRGDLASWLRVVATRMALRERARREVPADDGWLAEVALGRDVERSYLQHHYRAEVRAAFAGAMAALDAREKELLAYHYLDGLGLTEIAHVYRAHRLTVARWLDGIRQRLLNETRRLLIERVGAPQAECDSLLRLVQSQLEIPLEHHLRRA
jgi:RNA polymerase sigma-70 factor (ECF subfamily)